MATTDLGKWMITNGGEYDPDVTYEQLTMVMYDNSTYITLKTVTGVTPSNDQINYALMAQGFNPGVLSSVTAVDTSGALGNAGGTVSAQSLVDYLADAVMTKLVEKANISNVQVNDSSKVPSAALAYAMQQQITENEEAITGLNSNAIKQFNYAQTVFDFDDPSYEAGMYRLGSTLYLQNSPGDHMNYGNVLVIRNNSTDTLTMLAFTYNQRGIYFKSFNESSWADGEWGSFATKDDLAGRTVIWSGSLELSAENQSINISSAANYNQIIAIVKNSSNNVTASIIIDHYFFNAETNMPYHVNGPNVYATINIIPNLPNFRIRLLGESVETWVLTQIIGKM